MINPIKKISQMILTLIPSLVCISIGSNQLLLTTQQTIESEHRLEIVSEPVEEKPTPTESKPTEAPLKIESEHPEEATEENELISWRGEEASDLSANSEEVFGWIGEGETSEYIFDFGNDIKYTVITSNKIEGTEEYGTMDEIKSSLIVTINDKVNTYGIESLDFMDRTDIVMLSEEYEAAEFDGKKEMILGVIDDMIDKELLLSADWPLENFVSVTTMNDEVLERDILEFSDAYTDSFSGATDEDMEDIKTPLEILEEMHQQELYQQDLNQHGLNQQNLNQQDL